MTDDEALSIVRMIDGHWNMHMDDSTRSLWLADLANDDAESAVAVVAHLAKKMHYAPKIVDYREVMRMLHPPQEPPPLMPLPDDEGKRGVEAPEWVWVWSWARYYRDPREERPFPQQHGHVDETEIMTLIEYDELVAEWIEAGSPKSKSPLPATLR